MKSLLTAAVLSGTMTISASAAFIVSETVTPGTDALNGFDIHRYFAAFHSTFSDEARAGANGLQSAKVTLTTLFANGDFTTPSTQNFKFKFMDLDLDGESDADVNGATIPDSVARTDTTTVGTMIRVNVSTFFVDTLSPTGAKSDTNSDGTPDTFPSQNYASVKRFFVEGFSYRPVTGGPGFDASAKTANAGQPGAGALFAIAVVPTGTAVRAQGQLAPDMGSVSSFDTIPEPTTLGLFSGGAAGLLVRRRRNA